MHEARGLGSISLRALNAVQLLVDWVDVRPMAGPEERDLDNSSTAAPSLMSVDKASELFFRVSSGLKNIIGKDLITNDFVAIFELVKNSFDAHATLVQLYFDGDNLAIVDDGKGMSLEDLVNKWLFVAYSAKRDGTEDAADADDYRDRIRSRQSYAGSKGVGRFSCDRLGARLTLQSRVQGAAFVDQVEVDWDLFEGNDQQEFARIPTKHAVVDKLDVPPGLVVPEHGTVLRMRALRETWDRNRLLELKTALSKLINPHVDRASAFEITIVAPGELKADHAALGYAPDDLGEIPEDAYRLVANGPVKNFIFQTLRQKTTYLTVEVDQTGGNLMSELVDRGESVYRIREPNPYPLLARSGFSCTLFFLNQSAKMTFARRMGFPSTQFGSVFLFRNGFRIFPVGEDGDDTFGLDRRKQQGYSRYLGTRELIGRIDIAGADIDFKESSSRDQGLIHTPAYEELLDCFHEKCLKRMERYVVDISWKDKADKNFEDVTRMMGDKASARITDMVARLSNGEGVELLDYNPRMIRVLNERSEDFGESIVALRSLVRHSPDLELSSRLDVAQARYEELQEAEAHARQQADQERAAREAAERRARHAEAESAAAKAALEEEQKRGLFLASLSNVDVETMVNLHHQIVIYAADIQVTTSNQLEKLHHGEAIPVDYLRETFEHIAFKTQQVLAVSKFASKANFRLDSERLDADLASYILQYLQQVSPLYDGDGLEIHCTSLAAGLEARFKPIEVSMILDNLINNAKKMGALRIDFALSQPRPNELVVQVTDDGPGVPASIQPPSRIFEKGVTTTEGSGLGLFYVRYMLDQMGASIELDEGHAGGARFILRLFN
jgi:signal transduction histidine kinase